MKGKGAGSLAGLTEIHKQILAGDVNTQKLSIADIIIGNNIRNQIDKSAEDFLSLKSSIMQRGIIQPVTVKADDGKYTLVAGYRRVTAYTELVKAGALEDGAIPAYIVEIGEDVDYSAVQLIENIQREDLDIFDKGFGFYKLAVLSGVTTEPHEILSKLLVNYNNNEKDELISNFEKLGLVPSVRSVITAFQAICLPSSVIDMLRGRKEFHVSLVGDLYFNRDLDVLPELVNNYVESGFKRDDLLKAIASSKRKPAPPASKKKQISFVARIDKLIKLTDGLITLASDDTVRIKKKTETLEKITELREALDKAERLFQD